MKRKDKTFFNNWQTKILCFISAIAVYVFVSYGIQQKRVIKVPLEVIMPENYIATSIVPSDVNLVISGTEEVIYMIDASKFRLYADFSGLEQEGVASVPVIVDTEKLSSYIDISNVTIYSEPSFIRVYFEHI